MEQNASINRELQLEQQIAIDKQIIYLDFDGAQTSYNGELLTVEDIAVVDSQLDAGRIEAITEQLNYQYALDNVLFVFSEPVDAAEYSTIYIGNTDAFDQINRRNNCGIQPPFFTEIRQLRLFAGAP